MAPSKSPANRLHHIVDESRQIATVVAEISYEQFRDSWVWRRAVEHGLLIISEAVKSLPAELKAFEPTIPWRQIETLGNFLRHEYRDIEPEVIWRIAHENLPDLQTAALRLLKI